MESRVRFFQGRNLGLLGSGFLRKGLMGLMKRVDIESPSGAVCLDPSRIEKCYP